MEDRIFYGRFMCITLLGLLYSVGEFIQSIHFGPDLVRWYLSDFGFPFAAAHWGRLVFKLSPLMAVTLGGAIAVTTELMQFSAGHGDPRDMVVFVSATFVGVLIAKSKPTDN